MRHVDGWTSRRCRCYVCRADRIFDRVAFVVVAGGVLYFAWQIAGRPGL